MHSITDAFFMPLCLHLGQLMCRLISYLEIIFLGKHARNTFKKAHNVPKNVSSGAYSAPRHPAGLMAFSQFRDFSGIFIDFLLIPGFFFKVCASPGYVWILNLFGMICIMLFVSPFKDVLHFLQIHNLIR